MRVIENARVLGFALNKLGSESMKYTQFRMPRALGILNCVDFTDSLCNYYVVTDSALRRTMHCVLFSTYTVLIGIDLTVRMAVAGALL